MLGCKHCAWIRLHIKFIALILSTAIAGPDPMAGDQRDAVEPIPIVTPSRSHNSIDKTDSRNSCFRLCDQESKHPPISQQLEENRREILATWFPAVEMNDWSPICDVYLYSGINENSPEGRRAPGSLGHALVVKDGTRVLRRKIVLDVSHANSLPAVVRHEVAHVVIASYLDVPELPCWLDEGIAMSCEPGYRKYEYRQAVHSLLARDVLRSDAITRTSTPPRGHESEEFYIRAFALTTFLIETHGRETVLTVAQRCHREVRRATFSNLLNINDFAELDEVVKAHFEHVENSPKE